jgi:hypothetical protein
VDAAFHQRHPRHIARHEASLPPKSSARRRGSKR